MSRQKYPPKISDDEDEDNISEEDQTAKHTISISSDETDASADIMTSDDELPLVELQTKKIAHIEKIFPTKKNQVHKPIYNKKVAPASFVKEDVSIMEEKPRDPGVNKTILGLNVNLPVNPYGSQMALMSMLIKALKNGQNCLLESPTGSGKTLALLCGALAWLTEEKKKASEQKSKDYFSFDDVMDCSSPMKVSPGSSTNSSSPMKRPFNTWNDSSPSKGASVIPESFHRSTFGERSIYDKPVKNEILSLSQNQKQKELSSNPIEGSPIKGQVNIHNKRSKHQADNNEVSSRPPTIFYGARTHKQLEQVIKEFGRTSYCNQLKMTVLSSRDYSCIREFDKQMWGTKNEMCRGCLKKVKPQGEIQKDKIEVTNCKYYDNRTALRHERLPPAFDIEDLVKAGHELTSCPYFAAREMMAQADIVFCPYNYLIDPVIKSSMRLGLHDNVVIIDEAHNIEDVCREAATFVFTRDEVGSALKELEVASEYRYSGSLEVMPDMDKLIRTLKNWDQWFLNQSQLLKSVPMINNEAVYTWEAEHFANTLNNHNIGVAQYVEFQTSVTNFTQLLQNEPGKLIGVTQSTGALLESLRITLGYLFRDQCQYMDDYRPALVKSIPDSFQRNLSFNKKKETEIISLRLICLNPAVVFEGLKVARSIILSSGTLTPLISLESELGAQFPLKISPKHVISSDRVWIGTLTSHPNGRELVCKSGDTKQLDTQDALGQAILWVCRVTPNGVLCFLPSYQLMNTLAKRWQETGVWKQLTELKQVFQESKNARDHSDNMEDYYNYVSTEKGAVLFAVYRGKVSEGMDFKDHQARAVVTVGVPYPNVFDMAVKAKMQYNDKYSRSRNLLNGQAWLKVQAYRALNQAVGRCVRHIADWGAVLMIDSRFQHSMYTEHLSKWVANFLQNNHHTFESLVNSSDSLEAFMQNMQVREEEELLSKMT